MKICPSCGGKYDDTQTKCHGCGVKLHDVNDTGRFCKRCGRRLDADEIVCRVCQQNRPSLKDYEQRHESDSHETYSEPIDSQAQRHDEWNPQSLGGLKGWSIYFGIIFALFVMFGALCGYVYFKTVGDLFTAFIIGVAVMSLGLFYSMISTLFKALVDIIEALKRIVNQ